VCLFTAGDTEEEEEDGDAGGRGGPLKAHHERSHLHEPGRQPNEVGRLIALLKVHMECGIPSTACSAITKQIKAAMSCN